MGRGVTSFEAAIECRPNFIGGGRIFFSGQACAECKYTPSTREEGKKNLLYYSTTADGQLHIVQIKPITFEFPCNMI